MTPQKQLKNMLESTDRMDTSKDPESPLTEADPKSLDLFFSRIDTEMKLSGIPKVEDRDSIISYYRSLRVQFLKNEAAGITGRPVRNKNPTKEALKKFTMI